MKALKIVKAAVTRWLSHGAACKRCRERYVQIVEALDDITARDQTKPELASHRASLREPRILMAITFLEDVLSITNILSLVLQSDRKDFGAVRRAVKTVTLKLGDMAKNKECSLEKFQ